MAVIRSNGYDVVIGKDAFKALTAFLRKQAYSSCFILCDENTLHYCLPALITSCPVLRQAEIIEIESGEAGKSLEFSAHIWQTLIENKAGRQTLLLNLGGGVVSDLGGFTASVYKRGIDFINVPTSLLAMADASVGGKTAIDFSGVKNAIGSFAQPKGVFISPRFLMSLAERHFQNGLAEVYKMALICDKKFWQTATTVGCDAETLILKSVTLKNAIVQKDPFDKGLRNILNFGHSLGHALEALLLESKRELLHGEAVIIGMILESHISFQKRMLPRKELEEISSYFRCSFDLHPMTEISLDAILNSIGNDKKNSGSTLRFALIDKIGSCKFNIPVTEKQIGKALDYYYSLLA